MVSTTMHWQVRLFAICRERAQTDEISIEMPEAKVTVGQVKSAVAAQYPMLAPLIPAVRVAVNETFGVDDDPVVEGDELALIPPVSGG